MPELHLTVDTQIIMIGNGMSDLDQTPAHLQLMGHFDDAVFLALDNDGQIRAEYERKMGTVIPSKKTEPVSSGKAEPLGPTAVVCRARRARAAQLVAQVEAWSEGRPGVVA